MSTPEAQPDPLLELAAAEAADNETLEQPTQHDAQVEPEQVDDQRAPWEDAGFTNPEAVWKSYQNMQQKFRERDEEIGELRRQQREMAQQQQQMQQPQHGQQPAFPDGTPIYTPEQLDEYVDSGAITQTQANAVIAEQAAKFQAIELEQRLMQRLAPMEAANMNRGAQDALDELNVALGDDVVARHAEMIGRLITDDRAHYAHPQHGRRRLLEAVKSAEWDYQSSGGQGQPRDQNGRFAPADTYVEGGSSAQPNVKAGGTRLDADEQELLSSLVPQRMVDEAGIPIPWAR